MAAQATRPSRASLDIGNFVSSILKHHIINYHLKLGLACPILNFGQGRGGRQKDDARMGRSLGTLPGEAALASLVVTFSAFK